MASSKFDISAITAAPQISAEEFWKGLNIETLAELILVPKEWDKRDRNFITVSQRSGEIYIGSPFNSNFIKIDAGKVTPAQLMQYNYTCTASTFSAVSYTKTRERVDAGDCFDRPLSHLLSLGLAPRFCIVAS